MWFGASFFKYSDLWLQSLCVQHCNFIYKINDLHFYYCDKYYSQSSKILSSTFQRAFLSLRLGLQATSCCSYPHLGSCLPVVVSAQAWNYTTVVQFGTSTYIKLTPTAGVGKYHGRLPCSILTQIIHPFTLFIQLILLLSLRIPVFNIDYACS